MAQEGAVSKTSDKLEITSVEATDYRFENENLQEWSQKEVGSSFVSAS